MTLDWDMCPTHRSHYPVGARCPQCTNDEGINALGTGRQLPPSTLSNRRTHEAPMSMEIWHDPRLPHPPAWVVRQQERQREAEEYRQQQWDDQHIVFNIVCFVILASFLGMLLGVVV